MAIKELRDFIYETYYKRVGFNKENVYYSLKCQKKKDLQSFVNKLTKKMILIKLKNIISLI